MRPVFGVADAFFDVGAVAEPVFDVGDQPAVIAVVVGGDVGDDERDGICLVDVPAPRARVSWSVEYAPSPCAGSAEMSVAATGTRRTMV